MKVITRCYHSEEHTPENARRLAWSEMTDKTTLIELLVQKGFDIMNEEQESRAIWGLNFLQNIESESHEVTGAYNPEQQLWITQEQVQGSLIPEGLFGKLDPHGGLRGESGYPPKIGYTNTNTDTNTHKGNTNTGNGRDRDSKYDSDRDYDLN